MGRWRRTPARRASAWLHLSVIVVASLVGGAFGFVVAGREEPDQLVIGNTAGTLSLVARVGDANIVIGGGDSRSDLADLVGRSVAPLQRTVDLLLVPGWDDHQAIGAIGLIERGDVRRLVIAGEPGPASIWTTLQETARARSVELLIADGPHRIGLGRNAEMVIVGSPSPDDRFVVTLRLGDVQVAFVDATASGLRDLAVDPAIPAAAHLLIASRPLTILPIQTDVLVAPRPERSRQQLPAGPAFTAELGPGDRLRVDLTESTLRLPNDQVQTTKLDSGATGRD